MHYYLPLITVLSSSSKPANRNMMLSHNGCKIEESRQTFFPIICISLLDALNSYMPIKSANNYKKMKNVKTLLFIVVSSNVKISNFFLLSILVINNFIKLEILVIINLNDYQ